jgi:hypothetical protein
VQGFWPLCRVSDDERRVEADITKYTDIERARLEIERARA